MPLIELQNLGKHYKEVHALQGISAQVDGDVIGLLGPNGAGKSTLFKCLLGLTSHEGDATVLGLDTRREAMAVRDRVGYMPEMDSYLVGLTAVELCTFAGELSGLPKNEAMQRAHAALYYAGLEDKRYLKVDGYSTGLKQRVKLAQALVHDPELLFLDEPTNGLDPKARDEMLELIVDLPRKRGCSIVLSTHLLPDVDRICDHVLIMQRGQLRFSGTIASLRTAGNGGDAQVFEVEVRDDPRQFANHLKEVGCEIQFASEHRIQVTVPHKDGARFLLQEAQRENQQLRHLEIHLESLEQAFMRVVGSPL